MDLEKSFQSGIVLPKLEHHLGKYYLRSMVLEEERSDCSKKKRKGLLALGQKLKLVLLGPIVLD